MKTMLIDLLMGSHKKQLISSTIILIILFPIHVRNKKNSTDDIKFKLLDKDKKKSNIYFHN